MGRRTVERDYIKNGSGLFWPKTSPDVSYGLITTNISWT